LGTDPIDDVSALALAALEDVNISFFLFFGLAALEDVNWPWLR
jgi:hypothetical protein